MFDDETPIQRHAREAVGLFSSPLYREEIREGVDIRTYVSARLVGVSDSIEAGTDTADSRRLLEIFRSRRPETAVYDDAAKHELFVALRTAATFIPKGYFCYKNPPEYEEERPFPIGNAASRADTPRGAEGVRSYRRRLELSLRYQQLFLEAVLSFSKPSGKSHWHKKAGEARDDPFSTHALGLNKWSSGMSISVRLEELKVAVGELLSERSAVGAGRDAFIAASIEELVGEIDKRVEAEGPPKSWQERFVSHGTRLLKEYGDRVLEFEAGSRCWVVSDVHLGIGSGNDGAFVTLLDACEKGDRLILLGDILDFWIHLERNADLEAAVAAQWRLLHERLSDLRDRGVLVTYVPGNHDMFVFLLEGMGKLDWCSTLVARCQSLKTIHESLLDYPLSSVCEIVYPFVKLEFNGLSTLLTHGHAHELQWHFLTGNPYENNMIVAFIQTASTVMAYRFARQLRGLFNVALNSPTDWVRYTTDVAMSITNKHLNAFSGQSPRLNTNQRRAQFVDDLVLEFERQTSSYDRSGVQGIELRRAFDQLEQWSESPVAEIRAETESYLAKNPSGLNFRIWESTGGQPVMSTDLFQNIGPFDQFLCGHYHMPRDQHPDYDGGCLLRPGPTACMLITKYGKIVRPTGLFD